MAKRKRIHPNLKAYLKELRRSGVTQAAFAARMGISPQHLSDVKRGARGVSLPLAMRLADACGIPIESFLTEPEQRAS